MKTEVKTLLGEMLKYLRAPKNIEKYGYLEEAFSFMKDKGGIYHLVAKLINWLDPVLLNLPDVDSEKIELRGNEGIDYESSIKEMEMFFKYCPELNHIFKLKDEIIYFTPELTAEGKKEIRDFVDKNRERKVTNFYIPAKKYDSNEKKRSN